MNETLAEWQGTQLCLPVHVNLCATMYKMGQKKWNASISCMGILFEKKILLCNALKKKNLKTVQKRMHKQMQEMKISQFFFSCQKANFKDVGGLC